jgi:DivIVA domain-containing protein
MRRKKGIEQEAPATGDARITPEEVQRVEFRLSFRGYNERDVDAFLDRITGDLSSYLDELASATPAALPSSLDGGEPEEIVSRAREEAAEIVRRAEEQAEAIRAAAGAGGAPSGDRNAVAPFLNKERAFLQGLGSLVQTHAEDIKQMVLAIRERSAATGGGGADADRVPEPVAGPQDEPIDREPEDRSSLQPASAAEIRERLEAAGGSEASPVTLPDDDLGEPEQPEPIVVESATEPVYSSEGSPARERRERSLRELFWGEE